MGDGGITVKYVASQCGKNEPGLGAQLRRYTCELIGGGGSVSRY